MTNPLYLTLNPVTEAMEACQCERDIFASCSYVSMEQVCICAGYANDPMPG
jgi:hypothetical protein